VDAEVCVEIVFARRDRKATISCHSDIASKEERMESMARRKDWCAGGDRGEIVVDILRRKKIIYCCAMIRK
jgi:adenine/guanine phosphoribosyltransferase-like PRPP-binding protein